MEKIVLYILAGYVLFCLLLFAMQRSLLYMPDKQALSPKQAITQGLRHWPEEKEYRGFIASPEPDKPAGTVLLFHGNAGSAWHRTFYTTALSRHNFRVILAEYPGYGGRRGKISETTLVEDALQSIRLAHESYGGPLYLWGESLGCGVVAAALKKTDIPVKGAVLFLPWDSLPDLAQSHYWFLPARLLAKDRYNSMENLKNFEGRVAVLLAGEDEIIPIKHGKRLYQSLGMEKKLWIFDGARHNAMPVSPNLPWWKEVMDFVSAQDLDLE
ncbi:lysophospholipase [Desulfobotulus sp. H1]|uniref:Lysophospholipase n=1 Tax=Desulfobotulus pelophilus TaxID=2823377 RepID=A0ABT3N7P7_9BACT|nr:alpha/beta fold hydrolase [Desulfobotulus pelophilus]MCW7753492.1 lysophospholipase [Desulfobotulus pelophilus]